jgi:hypothetical protein
VAPEKIVRTELTLDAENMLSAWTQTGPPALKVIDHAMKDVGRRRMIVGDALLAAFLEGVKFAVSDLLGQLDAQADVDVAMGGLRLESDMPDFLAKYGADGG